MPSIDLAVGDFSSGEEMNRKIGFNFKGAK